MSSPSENVRSFRRRAGLSQEQLAEEAGLSVGVVRKIEQGGSARIETLHDLARALGVTTSSLFAGAQRLLAGLGEVEIARSTQVLVTTHSPALLSALDAADHEGVVVCWRDRETGTSRLTRLTEVDGYPAAMAAGSLGDVIIQGRLHTRDQGARDYTEFDRLLGIG